MQLEQRREFTQALALYNELLEANPANALVFKRKIAVLKAQKKTTDVVAALNEFLRSFGTDQTAVREAAAIAKKMLKLQRSKRLDGVGCVFPVDGTGRDVPVHGNISLRCLLLRGVGAVEPYGCHLPQSSS